jgi:hypothetical protein
MTLHNLEAVQPIPFLLIQRTNLHLAQVADRMPPFG